MSPKNIVFQIVLPSEHHFSPMFRVETSTPRKKKSGKEEKIEKYTVGKSKLAFRAF
jgi:hypothetical protein